MEPVTLINCFEVPAGREDEFLALWNETNRYMCTRPGYLSTRLHRSISPDARFRFVNVATWQTAEHFKAAHEDAGFQRLVAQLAWRDFQSTPGLYEVVASNQA